MESIVTRKNLTSMTISPYELFSTLSEISQKINKPNVIFKSRPETSTLTKKIPQMKRNDFNATSQVNLIQLITNIASDYYKDFWLTRLVSWKNRYYREVINYVIDIARTIWILTICPIYLIFVGIVILWILYYIRINSNELKQVLLIRKVMKIIDGNKVPYFTI
jgi:hypothetical protein